MGFIEKALEKAKRQRGITAEAEERVEVEEQTAFLERLAYTNADLSKNQGEWFKYHPRYQYHKGRRKDLDSDQPGNKY
jgi:hypothetical protein